MNYLAAFGALALMSAASVNADPVNIFWNGQGDPTTLDSDGDGVNDWVVRGGSFITGNTFADTSAEKTDGFAWHNLAGQVLDTRPLFNFANDFVVDMRYRAEGTGTASFWVNIDRLSVDNTWAAIHTDLSVDALTGTQKLVVYGKANQGGSSTELATYANLGTDFLVTKYDFDTAAKQLVVSINGVAQAALNYNTGTQNNADSFITLYGGAMRLDYYGMNPMAVIPLPPAAWAGLATLAGITGFRRLRRRG